jgi:hypothetical protein
MLKRWTWAALLIATAAGCQTPAGKGGDSSSPGTAAKPNALTQFLPDPERSFVFYPRRYPEGNWQPLGLPVEDAWFKSSDDTKLHGWYLSHPQPRGVVLYCHGNGGNVTFCGEAMRLLHDWVGVAVLAFDYRGYGRSEGTPSETGVLADARAARAWLAIRAGVDEKDILLLGRSLGGGVAVDLAANDGARGLVLESTFTSLPDVASDHYPYLPAQALMYIRFDSLSKIGRYHGPLLQSHGDADKVVAYSLGKKLHEAANPPKQFITIPGGDHNDPQNEQYYQALAVFIDRLAALPFPPRPDRAR